MKIQKNKFALKLLILGFLSQVSNAFAQTQTFDDISTNARTIFFEEGIPKDVLDNMEMKNLTIQVKNNKGEILANLNEASFADFNFSVPGDYSIDLKSDHDLNSEHKDCNHSDHERSVEIHVKPYNLSFLFDQVAFSSELIGGKEMSGTTLSIPLTVKLYKNDVLEVEKFKVITAGINTSLEGETNGKLTLNAGTNMITFHLQGLATKNTYIMFDFIDMDGRVHSFGYTTQLK